MKATRKLTLLLLPLTLVLPTVVSGQEKHSHDHGLNQHEERENLPPVFQDVSVHDPSIVQDGDTFYVFGSHIEAAKSRDLQQWTRITNGYTTPGNTLYGDLSSNLAGSFNWAGENDSDSKGGFAVWAPDVIWNPDYVNDNGKKGAYLIYYSASSTYIRSAIGFAVSDKIDGPYKYADTIVYSGFTANEAYDSNSKVNKKWTNTNIGKLVDTGVLNGPNDGWFNTNGSYNNYIFPNAIDAAVFRDEKGQLWMTYGSWSGGIYLLELDKKTGKPKYPGKDGTTADGRSIDRYFGTKIAGGYYKSGEGPYIVYDRETKFYHLYVTYGWLGADGGYNMRVFRSKNPDGPYVDSKGAPAALPTDTDNAPYGNKLMGNFLFDRKVGDPGMGIGYGYMSPGHNSVLYDRKTGKRFVVFHTRFLQKGEMHEVRVHQLFLNKDGWPIAAPYRYAGEDSEQVTRQELPGYYKLLNHGTTYSAAVNNTVLIRLNENNTVSGALSGSWQITGRNKMRLTLEDVAYDGLFLRQWDPVSRQYVMAFTALSGDGITVWGSRMADKSAEQIVSDVYGDLNLGDTSAVTSNITLPTEGTLGAAIAWQTSDPAVVTDTGIVIRPDAGSESRTATLTAVIVKDGVSKIKAFTVTVLPRQAAKLAAHFAFEDNLSDSTGSFDTGAPTGDRVNNSGGIISYADGKSGKAAVFDGSSGVLLPKGLIADKTYSVALWLKPEQLTTYTTTFFGAKDPNSWVSVVPKGPVGDQTMVWSGSAWYDAVSGMTIPTGQWTHVVFTVDSGSIRVYVNGVEKFSGSNFPNVFSVPDATFSLGVNWWDVPYKGLIDELRIYSGVLTPADVTALTQQ